MALQAVMYTIPNEVKKIVDQIELMFDNDETNVKVTCVNNETDRVRQIFKTTIEMQIGEKNTLRFSYTQPMEERRGE